MRCQQGEIELEPIPPEVAVQKVKGDLTCTEISNLEPYSQATTSHRIKGTFEQDDRTTGPVFTSNAKWARSSSGSLVQIAISLIQAPGIANFEG